MKTTFVPSVSVYDGYGDFIGRLEAYRGDETNYAPTFHPAEDHELSSDDLQEILDYLNQNFSR
jgi:hypothetical protein